MNAKFMGPEKGHEITEELVGGTYDFYANLYHLFHHGMRQKL